MWQCRIQMRDGHVGAAQDNQTADIPVALYFHPEHAEAFVPDSLLADRNRVPIEIVRGHESTPRFAAPDERPNGGARARLRQSSKHHWECVPRPIRRAL